MPGTFLVGHGAYVSDAQTFVPNSMTVHLYAAEGESIPAINIIEILRYRGGGSVGTLAGGQPIYNLFLTPLNQNQYETELGAVQRGEIVCFVGYDTPVQDRTGYTLCADVCDSATGVHNCLGLFGVFKDVTDLHLLVCLDEIVHGTTSDENTSQDDNEHKNLPWEAAEPDHYNRITALATQIMQAAQHDPGTGHIADYENATAAQIFDGLPYEDQVKLMTFEPVQRWSYVRYARRKFQEIGPVAFREWTRGQQPWVNEIYRRDTDGVGQYVA